MEAAIFSQISETDLFRSIFSAAGIGIAVLNSEGVIQEANPALENFFGVNTGEARGRPLFSFAHPTQAHDYASSFVAFQRGGFDKFSLDGEYIRSDGASIWGRLTVTTLQKGDGALPFSAIALMENITAKRQAQLKLQENENQFRTLVSNLPGIAYRCANDKDWTMFYVSEGIQKITGYPASEFLGPRALRTYASVIHPDDARTVDEAVEQGLSRNSSFTMEYRLVRADGSIAWVHEKGQGVYSSSGRLEWLDGFIMDISDQIASKKLLEEQRAQMVAASKLSSLGQMSAGIAHEINNPLAIIHGEAAVLREFAAQRKLNSALVVKAAEKIEATALRISKIIKSLKFFAREGERDPLQAADLAQILEETAEFCRERFKSHGVDFRLSIGPGNMALQCRSVQISQVIVNLLNNSFDAVEIQDPGTARWIEAGVEDRGDWLELSVSDSGPGIPEPLHGQIMLPFFTTKDVGKGTGLGLSVSSGIVESHHGTLRLDAKAPHTRFVVRLPRRP